MATPSLHHEPLYDDLLTLRGDLASARCEIDDLRAELDCLIEHHGDKLGRLWADLRNLTEWLYPTETVYPPHSPPEVVDVEPRNPYEDAPDSVLSYGPPPEENPPALC